MVSFLNFNLIGIESSENGPEEQAWNIRNDYNPTLFKKCIKSLKISLEYN